MPFLPGAAILRFGPPHFATFHPMKKTIQAFTLVELLVVIVIIAILAGIALPVFQKAQEKGKAISDMSNLRQLGIGIQAYKGDNDGSILALSTDVTPAKAWPEQLNPTYVSSWKVFKSPFDTRTSSETASAAPVSYGINDEKSILGIDSSKFNYPSNLVMMIPAVNAASSSLAYDATAIGTAEVKVKAPTIDDRGTHGSRKRVNVLFADGHTEDILWIKLRDKTTSEGLKRWVYDTP